MAESKLATVAFKCNESESEQLKDLAAAANCTVSKFVHDLVINAINKGRSESSLRGPAFQLVLSPKLQEHFVQGIVLSNLLTQKKMTDNGEKELFMQASARATEIVHNMLPPGWSGIDDEQGVIAGD